MIKNFIKNAGLPIFILSSFWLLTLLNPVFKKYDYGAEWPMVILLGGLCVMMFLGARKQKIYLDRTSVFEKIFAAGFLIFYLVSFIFSETKNIGFNEFLAFASCFSVYFIFAYRENPYLLKFLKVVGVGAVIACGVGFGIYLLKDEPSRMIGPFYNIFYASNLWPNAFALFLVTVAPLFIFLASASNGVRRILWLTALGILLSSLFLTYSRGAILTGILEIVLLGIYFAKRINFSAVKKILYVAVLACALVLLANYVRDVQFNNVVSLEDKIAFKNQESFTSVKERYDFWKGAINMSFEKPWTGYGPFSFRYVYGATQQKDLLAIADHPHNVFLKIASENGLIAFMFFFLFLLAIFIKFVFNFQKIKSSEQRDLAYVIFVSIAGAFAHNMIDYNFNFLANILLVFVLLAILRLILVQNSYSTFGVTNSRNDFLVLVLGFVLFIVSFYEGGILVLSKTYDENVREYSLYPRDYFSDKVVDSYEHGYEFLALSFANQQLDLNGFDAETLNYVGAIYLEIGSKNTLVLADHYFTEAIIKNPYNDFKYYANEYNTLKALGETQRLKDFEVVAIDLLKKYFSLAENNVHFTSYTKNADAAAYLYKKLLGSDDLLRIIEKQRASRK